MENMRNKHIHLIVKRFIVDGIILEGFRCKKPKRIVIEPTNICSLKCRCCPNGYKPAGMRPNGMMSRETFDKVLANLDFSVKECFLHLCGEPLLNKNIDYFASALSARGIRPVIFSNGINPDMDLLERVLAIKGLSISFSMELQSEEEYESIRVPAKYADAENSLVKINALCARMNKFFNLNMIVGRETDRKALFGKLGQLYEKYDRCNKIILSSQWPWPALPETGDLINHLAHSSGLCSVAKQEICVLWDGRVSLCSFDYCGSMIIGDAGSDKLSSIYNGRKARMLRRAHMMHKTSKSSLCDKCLLTRFQTFEMTFFRNRFLRSGYKEKEIIDNLESYYAY